MKKLISLIGICLFIILEISAQSINWEFNSNFPSNGFSSQFDSSGVHSLTVDGEGKIWFQIWNRTNQVIIDDQTEFISSIFIFHEDGTEASISPINLLSFDSDTTYFTESNARGMTTDQNGDIIASYGEKLFRIDHLTGQGLSEFISPNNSPLTKPSVSNDGNIVIGHVFPDLPIYYLDEDFNIISNVVDSRTDFARNVEISEDGKDVFVFKITENRIEVHSLDTLNNTFTYSRDILSGISAESSTINGEKLWVGGGHNNEEHTNPEFQKYTWYEFDLKSEAITNQIKWNFSGENLDLRPRGIAFSLDGNKTYLGQFFGDGLSIIQQFQPEVEDKTIVTVKELNTYQFLEEYSASELQNHPLAGEEVTYTGVIISNPKSSGLATASDFNNDGIIDDVGRIHIFITDTAAVEDGREGMSIQITESDWELLDTLERGDVVTFKGELTFFNATSQMTVNEEPEVLGSVFGEYARFESLLEPWEVSIDEINTLNPDGTEEINFSNYTKYNGSYVKFKGVSVSNVSNSSRLVWSLNSGTSRIFVYDHSLRVRNDRNNYLEGWNFRRDSENDFIAPEVGSIANVSGFLAITNYNISDLNLSPNKDVFTLSPFEDGILWIDETRFEDGDDIGGGEILDWPNDIEIVEDPIGENSYNLDIDFKVNMAVQQEIGKFDPQDNQVLISGTFNSWSTTQDTLSIDSDTTFATKLTIPSQMVGDSLIYKFIIVDEEGEVTWEIRNDRIYTMSGIEPDLNLDGTRGIVLNHLFNDEGYEIIDNEDLEIRFSVDMSVQKDLGNFVSGSQTVRVSGSFNGWNTTNAPELSLQSDSTYAANILVENIEEGSEVYFKYIIEENGEVLFEELDGKVDSEIIDNRIYTFTGLEEDNNSDGIKDVQLQTVLFGNESTVEKLRDLDLNTEVRVKGLVTRALGRVSMIQNGLFGIATFDNSGIYFDAILNESIEMGDSLQIFGTLAEFSGLRQINEITNYEVLSRNNALPSPQELSLFEINEDYESEIVKITGLSINSSDNFFQNSTTYELNVAGQTDTTVALRIQSSTDTELGGISIPNKFEFIGIIGQFSSNGLDGYQLIPINSDDIIASDSSNNNSSISLSIDSVFAFITDTITIPISISGLSELPLEAFEIELGYDSDLLDIELAEEQSGSVTENFLLEVNNPQEGLFVISGASTNSVNTDGELLFLTIYPQSAGSGGINVNKFKINEDGELVNPAFNQITIIERLCGDVTNDMTVSTLDASYVLRHTVLLAPQYPLMGLDSLAADVTGNGDISAFDASKILQFEVGFIDNLSCKPINAKKKQLFTKANWNMVESNNDLKLNIDISATDFDVYSAQLELDISDEFSFNGVKNVPKNWQVITNKVNGKTKISMFGIQPLKQKELEISIRKNNEFLNSKIKGTIALNESSQADLSELWVNNLPEQFDLSQNYPNPFNPSTNIEYSLPEQSNVRLTIFNMLGQEVATLINNESKKAGVHTVNWNAGSVASGIYFYRLSVGHRVFTKRMMLIK